MCERMEQELSSGPRAAQQARDLVTERLNQLLGSTPRTDVTDDARLVASELVTNAIRAGSPSIRLVIEVHHDAVRIEVHDEVLDAPQLKHPQPTANTGRGLLIVDQVAQAWGSSSGSAGKAVWAVLDVPPTLTSGGEPTLDPDPHRRGVRAAQRSRRSHPGVGGGATGE